MDAGTGLPYRSSLTENIGALLARHSLHRLPRVAHTCNDRVVGFDVCELTRWRLCCCWDGCGVVYHFAAVLPCFGRISELLPVCPRSGNFNMVDAVEAVCAY